MGEIKNLPIIHRIYRASKRKCTIFILAATVEGIPVWMPEIQPKKQTKDNLYREYHDGYSSKL